MTDVGFIIQDTCAGWDYIILPHQCCRQNNSQSQNVPRLFTLLTNAFVLNGFLEGRETGAFCHRSGQ